MDSGPERLRPTLGMNSGQPPQPPERLRPTLGMDSGPEILRPTIQLKIKANSWNGFRPTPPPPPRKIKANSSTEN